MNHFLQRHADRVTGMLSGLDRILFRGTLRLLANVRGLMNYLWARQVLLKDFGDWSQQLTRDLRAASEAVMVQADRPLVYVNSVATSKEDVARSIARRDGIESGPVCLISSVDPCMSYELVKDRLRKRLRLEPRERKCLHLYHYHLHETFGLMHVRLQTWLPFEARVCLNGREWLCRELSRRGVDFTRRDNCLVKVADVPQAQAILDQQVRQDWPGVLAGLERAANPARASLLKLEGLPLEHYWSVEQSEWASDVMFKSPLALAAVYPALVRHGITSLSSGDVLRFLGKRLTAAVNAEVGSDLKTRIEGVRLKHRVGANSVKLYDKQGSVLRVETTINDARAFKVYRGTEAEPDNKQWRKLRKGVADMPRRCQVSQASNDRYLSYLSAVPTDQRLEQTLVPLTRGIVRQGRRYRGLRLLSEQDDGLLAAAARGEWAISGFSNADIRQALMGADPSDAPERRRRSGQVTRLLGLLHAHGLINKVPRRRLWRLSDKGKLVTALLAATRQARGAELLRAA